jgi:hypothetical protein
MAAQFVAGNDLPGACQQERQGAGRLRLEADRAVLPAQFTAIGVELEQAEPVGHGTSAAT